MTIFPPIEKGDLLTLQQAGELTQAPAETVRHWLKTKKLRGVRIGKRTLIHRLDLHALVCASACGRTSGDLVATQRTA